MHGCGRTEKKCACRNIRNLPSAWNLNALKMNFWIMPDQKKKAGVIKSLHPQVHWYTVHVQLVQYELGPFFLLSKKPGVFRNKLGNTIIILFGLNTLPRACFLVVDMPTWLWDLSYKSWTNLCMKVSLLQFTQTLLRACFILLLTYKNIDYCIWPCKINDWLQSKQHPHNYSLIYLPIWTLYKWCW